MQSTFFESLDISKPPRHKRSKWNPCDIRPSFEFRFTDRWAFDRTSAPPLERAPDRCGVEFAGDLWSFAEMFHHPLRGVEVDLIRVALSIYFADRCALRHPNGRGGRSFWRRRIHLVLPVKDVKRWNAVEGGLSETLEFLTEDDWTFQFEERLSESAAESQGHLKVDDPPNVEWVALFSGGLDSIAGALQWLSKSKGVGVLVSGKTNSRLADGQAGLLCQLRDSFPGRVAPLGVSYGFPDKKRFELGDFEPTQRTRAFVHTAMGAVAAQMARKSELLLFENGFGALNLPCDSSQFGSMNSMGTHPVFLKRMSDFIGALLEETFVISNPCLFSTKGQMLSAPSALMRQKMLRDSFSCDLFPNYHHKERQCGSCPSCLIRRLSFHSADITDQSDYTTDVFRPKRPLREVEWTALAKLSRQADTFSSCLDDEDPWKSLCLEWPCLRRAELEMGSSDFSEGVRSLLVRHVAEWRSFSSKRTPIPGALAA